MTWEEGEAPEGWNLSKLGEVAQIIGGGTPKTSVPGNFSETEGHSWITPSDLTGYEEKYIGHGRRFLTDQGLATSSAKYMPAGAVLFSTRAPIGYVAVADRPVTTNQGFRSFVPNGTVDSEYIYYALKFLRPLAEQMASGTTFAELSGSNAANLPIAYPSLETQHEIVRVLDSAGEKSRSATLRLISARRAIERFRQAVLVAGCSGRLTAEWREERDLPSSSDLLAEPRTRNKASVLPPNTDELGELPTTWAWAAVGEIGDVQLGGTPSRKNASYWNGTVPWVSSGEVANCRIARTRETITEVGLANSSAKLYPAGTVLIAMIGEGKTRGQAAILDIEACTNQNAAGIVSNTEFVSPEYVWRWALAQYEVTRAVGRGGNQPALNKQKVKELSIPVPPLEEQDEIVRRIDQLLALADSLEQRIDVASKRVERSSQALLTKAFRGELGFTDGT